MNKFQINPKTLTIIAACVAIATLLANGSVQAPVGIPATWAAAFVSWDDFFLKLWSVAAPILIGYSSSQPGPFAPPDPPSVKAAMAKEAAASKAAASIVSVLLIGFLALVALSLVAPSTSWASGTAEAKLGIPASPTPNINLPPSSTTPGSASTGTDAGPLSDLADLFASDFASAATLATSTSIKDGNGQACWTAFGPFGEIVKAHPHVFSGKLATDIEAQRLEVIAARHLCDNVACQTVFTEAATAVSKLASTLPISINVNITPINLFAKACADVPNIVVVAPTPEATPTATPTSTGG